MQIVIYGAGSHAVVLADILQHTARTIVALFNDWPVQRQPIAKAPVVVGAKAIDEWLSKQSLPLDFAIAIGNQAGAKRLSRHQYLMDRGLSPLTLVHPRACVLSGAIVGQGCQILLCGSHGRGHRLGDQVILNTGAIVDHECVLEDGLHVGPGARIAGPVKVGASSFLGTGAVVLPDLAIGANVIVGAGAVVTRDVPDGVVVAGAPAREIKNRFRDNG